jgi:hypothetical protein
MSIWDSMIEPFVYMAEELIGNPLLIGAVIFIFFTFFGLLMFIPYEAMVVIWIPASFVIAIYIPPIQILVAVILGIIVGLGIIKWVRR